ncbi:hypothetical protein Acr_07g0000270 [Actinidia rufa]|uniref:Protein kinase domain-containing protein n=1 Tax=Actinidia rufa TaxID=165716 RepID=A0A7J0EU08_9ERIC|nr:hypothetical protein Acr_07g0000270 [Actinidia rufa]
MWAGYTSSELSRATNDFSPEMVIGEGGNSKVYWATLEGDFSVAVKVLKNTESSAEDLFREVETLSNLKHENIV